MRLLDARAVAALGPAAAVESIRDALRAGFDPSTDPRRVAVPLSRGEFLVMPSEADTTAGVKVVTVAPGNAGRGLPRVQGVYLLFDATTLAVRAVLDGAALTTLRTPAAWVAALPDPLPNRPLRVAVVGAGPQARGHVATLAAVRILAHVTYLVRDPARTPLAAVAVGSDEADERLRTADVVVCATTARTPLFASDLLRDDAVVIAVGSHERDARELDARLMHRGTVVVEDVTTALREAGDIVLAIAEGQLAREELVPMRDLVVGAFAAPTDRPLVFKSVGMSWEDLAVATAVAQLGNAV